MLNFRTIDFYRLIYIASAAVLFLSGLLKLWALDVGQLPIWYFTAGKLAYSLVICAELLLSFLLLVVCDRLVGTIACFMITIFLCFNLLWFVTGVTSCGCFGTIQLSPLVMLVFDSCWLVLMLFAITKSPIPLDHWVFSHQRRLVLGVLVSLTPLGALLHNDGFTHVWAGSQTRVENAILPLDADLGIVESTRLKLIVLSTSCSECRRLASDSETISQFDGVV